MKWLKNSQCPAPFGNNLIFVTHERLHFGFKNKDNGKWVLNSSCVTGCCDGSSEFKEFNNKDVLQWHPYSKDLWDVLHKMESKIISMTGGEKEPHGMD